MTFDQKVNEWRSRRLPKNRRSNGTLEAEIIRLTARVAELEGTTVMVNPLVWKYHGGDEYCAKALNSGLRYFHNDEGWWIDGGSLNQMPRESSDAQKRAAAQADYTASIRAALFIPTPTEEIKV